MDASPLQRMFQAAQAEGITALAAFGCLCAVYASRAKREVQASLEPSLPPLVDRNLSPAAAAERLGISVRKLTRGRFTVYRHVCIPIEGQSRGYVVSERALNERLARQRARR